MSRSRRMRLERDTSFVTSAGLPCSPPPLFGIMAFVLHLDAPQLTASSRIHGFTGSKLASFNREAKPCILPVGRAGRLP